MSSEGGGGSAESPSASAEGAPATRQELAAFARHYTRLAEQLFGRSGLAVRVVDMGTGVNVPPGTTDLATETIVINAQLLGDLRELTRDQLDSVAKVTVVEGVLRREVGRLRHSVPHGLALGSFGLASAVAVLEEIRVEAQVVAEHPDDARWMRAAANAITLGTLDLASFNASFRTLSAATLTLGRIHAGTLLGPDVADLVDLFRVALGEEVFSALDELFADVVRIPDGDVDSIVNAARRLLDLVGQTDGLDVSVASTLHDQSERALQDSAASARDELRRSDQLARAVQEQLNAALGVNDEPAADAADVHATGAESDRLVEIGTRPPTERELIDRNRMVRLFRSARFRDREMLEQLHALPPGRLRVSGLVQRDAALAQGALSSGAPAFERRRHRHVDEPLLSVGLAVDTSGSMSGKERLLGGALYTFSSAITNAGGNVAIAAFGDAAIPISGPGTPLRGVPRIIAQGGTAYVAEAVDFVTRVAALDRPRHVRQLYVLSDGEWQDKEEVEKRFRALDALGCSVLVIDFGTAVNTTSANVHLMIRDIRQLADVLARLFESSYRNAG